MQWQISCDDGATWTPVLDGGPLGVNGATTKTLTISNLSADVSSCQFRLASKTDACETVYSEKATVVTEGPLSINEHPQDVTVCAGESVCFSILANNAGEGQIAYRWQSQQQGATQWSEVANAVDISGAKSNILCLKETAIHNGLVFRALVKTPNCGELISAPAAITLDGPLVIQSIPANSTVNAIENATFNAEIVNLAGGAIQYQWQQSTDGINWSDMADGTFGNNQISGTNTTSLAISPAIDRNGYQFRLLASSPICGEIFTPAATLSVIGTQLTIVEDLDQPVIESCGGEYVILVVTYENTEGIPAQMVWETSTDGIIWTPVPNSLPYQMANQPDIYTQNRYAAVLAIDGTTALDGKKFRCRLISSIGLTAISSTSELDIAAPISIATQPKNAAVCFNEGHTFSAVLNNAPGTQQFWTMSTDGGDTWIDLEENMPTGAGGIFENVESPNLHITSVEGLDGNLFRLIVQNGACAVVSDEVSLTVEDSPQCYPASHFVDYKLKLRPDGQSWGVWIKAKEGFQPTGYNLATSGRIVIAASAGFAYYDLKSQAGGEWKPGKYKLDAPETPGMSYYTFDLKPGSNVLNLQQDNEIMLFSFRRMGSCPDKIYLAHDFVPSGIEPNLFTGTDLGTSPATNFALNEVYEAGAANCNGGGQNYAVNPNNGNLGSGFNPANANTDDLIVYPNPATDWLDIRLPEMESMENTTLSIMANNGAILRTYTAQPFYQKIELNDLPTGLYFITLEKDGETIGRQKFIKK